MRRGSYPILATVILLLLSACAVTQADQSAPNPTEPAVISEAAQVDVMPDTVAGESVDVAGQSDQQEMVAETFDEGPGQPENIISDASDEANSGIERPAWQNLPLTNARTGEAFTFADFEGKTVFVEPMATWCSNCRRQLGNVRQAQEQLAGDDVVFVALSVETNIDDATLASYADGAGFDWLFAVATPDMLKDLADEFGRSIVNPPATPHFIIRPDGTSTELVTGIEAADQIVAQIKTAQG